MVFSEAQPPFLSNKSVSGISPWKPVELRSRWKEALRWPRGTQQPPGGSSSPLAARLTLNKRFWTRHPS